MKARRITNPFRIFARVLKKCAAKIAPEQVHALRTMARRMHVLSQRMVIDRKQASTLEAINELRKRTGKIRDLDVQLALLHELSSANGRTGVAILRQRLQEKRSRAETKLLSRIEKLNKRKHLARMNQLAVRAPVGVARPEVLTEARTGLSHMLAERLEDPRLRSDAARLHELRIELKKVRYLSESAGPMEEAFRFAARLKITQDALGRWHDWTELLATSTRLLSDTAFIPLQAHIRGWTNSAHSAAIEACERLAAEHPAPKKDPRPAQATVPHEVKQA